MEIPAIKRSKERDFHFLLSLLLGEQYTAYSNWVMRTIMATPSRRATTLTENNNNRMFNESPPWCSGGRWHPQGALGSPTQSRCKWIHLIVMGMSNDSLESEPAVKGRISLDAISTEPPSTRDTMQPVKAPTAVSSWSMIACNVHGYTLAAHSGNRHTLWGETPDWMRMA